MNKFLCFFGFHKWKFFVQEIEVHETYTETVQWHECQKCGKIK